MKKHIFLLLLLLLVYGAPVKAQTDSLLQALQHEQRDTSRVMLYCQLSRAYLFSKTDTALLLAQQGLVLTRQAGFTKGEGESLLAAGRCFLLTGNYPKALELLLEALKKYESIQNQKGIGMVLNTIGVAYAFQTDHKKALHYLSKAKAIHEARQDKRNLTMALINLGNSHEQLNQLDSARLYTQQGYELSLAQHDEGGTSVALNNLGNIYSKMGEFVIAMEFYKSSLSLYRKHGDDDGVSEATLGMSKLFQKAGQLDSCLYYAKLSLDIAQRAGFTSRVLDASVFLAGYYKAHDNIDSAYLYQSASIVAKDSLFSQEKSRQLQQLSFAETLRQQEMETARMAAAEKQKHNLQYAGIAVVLVIGISLFLLLSRSIIVNEKWIEFLGVLGLLVVFEFINLFINPYLAEATNHSPVLMLLVLVVIAALLVPLHHRIEHWVTHQMIAKNKRIRLAAAKRIVAKLEGDKDAIAL